MASEANWVLPTVDPSVDFASFPDALSAPVSKTDLDLGFFNLPDLTNLWEPCVVGMPFETQQQQQQQQQQQFQQLSPAASSNESDSFTLSLSPDALSDMDGIEEQLLTSGTNSTHSHDNNEATGDAAAAAAAAVAAELQSCGGGKIRQSSTVQKLTEEEKRLLVTEQGWDKGFDLPLTKTEEKDLKARLRKIRNKLSAQKSRRKQNEYVQNLETRVEACTKVNFNLQKRVRVLEHEKRSLLEELDRLKMLVTQTATSKVKSGAGTLMLIAMSFALMCSPTTTQLGATGGTAGSTSPASPGASSYAPNGHVSGRTLQSFGELAPELLPNWDTESADDKYKRAASAASAAVAANTHASSGVQETFASLLSTLVPQQQKPSLSSSPSSVLLDNEAAAASRPGSLFASMMDTSPDSTAAADALCVSHAATNQSDTTAAAAPVLLSEQFSTAAH